MAAEQATADATREAPGATRHEATTLPVIPPAVARDEVESTGRVGAVAYPYRVYEASVTVDRAFLPEREVTYVASVDRSRRLVLRADTVPEAEPRSVADVLVLPAELTAEQSRERARETVFGWTMRKFALGNAPDIEFARAVDAYKLFWVASRPDGDVIVDSVRGDESPLRD